MTREQRITNIKRKIAEIDKLIGKNSRRNSTASMERLWDRRDRREEHLVLAEIGPLAVYSKVGKEGA